MTHGVKRVWLTGAVAVLAAIAVAAAGAGTINGTAKNDTERGTPKADKLYGKGGNDKLYGLAGNDYLNGGAGNDVLTGGPGADTLVCGPGIDTAVADVHDKIAADCEKVTGLPKPGVSVADVSQPEGSGPGAATFTVTLGAATPLRVTVSYATADGTASAGSDYTATSGKLTFAPGETSKTVNVPIIGDTTVEPNESFSLDLSSPVNARLARGTATATLVNDDVPKAQTGHFHGQVNNGGAVDFDVNADGTAMTNVTFNFTGFCQPSATLDDAVTAASLPINNDLSINGSGSGPGFTIQLTGNFTQDGRNVQGTMDVHEAIDYQGTHYECDSGVVGWAATFTG